MPKNKAINAMSIVPNANSVVRHWNNSVYVTYCMMISLLSEKRGIQKKNRSPSFRVDWEGTETAYRFFDDVLPLQALPAK